MEKIERRSVLAASLAFPLAAFGMGQGVTRPNRAIHLTPGADRLGKVRKVLGGMKIDFKIAAADTDGALLLLEHSDSVPGGPPKHVHHDQEEWFYVLEGRYVMVVGEDRFELGPGDSVLAPRKVPHVWAHVGEGPGRILVGFQPAGEMQAFFEKLAKVEGVPDKEATEKLFKDHGMEVLGPPLAIQR